MGNSISLLAVFVLLSTFVFSQELCDRVVEGQVLDIDTQEPLPFATVQIANTQKGAVCDTSGHFKLTGICKDEVDLEIHFLGYKKSIHHHDFHHNNPTIYLAPEETMLESVVIEEELNAHEIKSIPARKIKITNLESLGTNAGDLLTKSSGISTLKTGQNVVKPMVHGLHSNRVLIINNGVRHANQAWGEDHGLEVDISQVNQIQLIKGASTVRYGSDALGGVILFNAPSPHYSSKLSGDINGGFKTNGRGFSGEVSLEKGYERVALRASISGNKFGDLTSPDYQLTNTGKQEIGFTANGKFHFPTVDLDLFVSHFEQELGILRGSVSDNLDGLIDALSDSIPDGTKPFSYSINNPRQEVTHDLFRLGSSIYIGDQQFDIQYAFQRNSRQEFDVRRGSNNDRPAINLELFAQNLDIDWDHPSKGKWVGTIGLQLATQDNNNIAGTNTIPFVPNFNTNSFGLFGIESYTSGSTTLEAGVRFDFNNFDVRGRDTDNDIYRDNVSYANLSYTLGIIKEFGDHFSLRSNLGSAWRAPNVSELYSFGKHQNVFQYGLWRYQYFPANDSISTSGVLSNDDKEVKSERGLKWITTFNYSNDKLELEITPHVNWIKNYFFLRPFGITNTVRGAFPYFIHDQTDAIYAGIDVDVRNTWSKTLNTELKLSYVYARDIQNDQYFVGIPPLNMKFSIEKQFGNFFATLTPEFEAQQKLAPAVIPPVEFASVNPLDRDRSGTFDFMEAPDYFFLLNASFGYQQNNFEMVVRGKNILNSSYRRYTDNLRYYADDIGISLGVYASYSF